VALDAPLNRRQVEVLRWISEGCPDGRWTDFTFKTTATALASRRLVTVSKRGGVWSAASLPAGAHYLANGVYPPGHWVKRQSAYRTDLDVPVRPAAIAERPVAAPLPDSAPLRPKKQSSSPDELTPTRKLVKDIVDAGGILEIDTKDDNTSYRALVSIINRRRMAPDDQEVLMVRGKTYHHVVFRLSSVSDWQTDSPSDVVAAERIGRWHPAVATLRAENRLDSVDKALRGRAFRLLHALAREAEARGHSVRLPNRNRHGYVQDGSKLGGDMIFKIGEIDCSVDIWQPKDRVDHVPTPDEIEREKKYGWGPRRYDHVAASRLSIAADTNSRFSSKETWTETKTISLQTRLPDVMMTFERWAVIDAEGKEAERRAEIERRAREEREDALAREAYIQHRLGELLLADASQWELSKRLRKYLAEMAARIEAISDAEEREAAVSWVEWCEAFATKQDPFERPIRQPKVKEPGYSELQEFRKRLGLHRSFW
jgi:hypothetical protein